MTISNDIAVFPSQVWSAAVMLGATDAVPSPPIRNQTYYATTHRDITQALRVSFQGSYGRTNYAVLQDDEACIFHTQFMWKF
jgi:hypothetical protein